MKYPKIFEAREYVKWHNATIISDIDLANKLEALRNSLLIDAHSDLSLLNELFTYLFKYSKREYAKQKSTSTEYFSPLNKALKKPLTPIYSNLFKEPTSIINKLWRKNKERVGKDTHTGFICLSNIKTEITDLVRTEIIGTTLDSCKFIADRFTTHTIYDNKLKSKCEKFISKIIVQPEIKMDSGYFAYHVLIHFKSGVIIEVQIYSSIIKKWRELSHTLYRVARLEPIQSYTYGTTESKLISLGHLFHIAECELESLQTALRINNH